MIVVREEPSVPLEDGEMSAPGWRLRCESCGEELIRLTTEKPDDPRPCLLCRRAAAGID